MLQTEQNIMFVTDPVEPLSNQLKQNPDKNLILWGLYKIAVSVICKQLVEVELLNLIHKKNAVKFLNNDCDMVHGSVKVASVFTNKAGEWKLGGFELLCSMKEESPIVLVRVDHMPSDLF